LIDTSVVIDLEVVDVERLPREVAVSAMTMANLAAGPHTTADRRNERAVRTDSNAPSQRSNRCLSMRGWRVRTAVCAQSALRPAAKRAGAGPSTCSSPRPPWPRICPCIPAIPPISQDSRHCSKSSPCDAFLRRTKARGVTCHPQPVPAGDRTNSRNVHDFRMQR
jgi:hypothetical protein